MWNQQVQQRKLFFLVDTLKGKILKIFDEHLKMFTKQTRTNSIKHFFGTTENARFIRLALCQAQNSANINNLIQRFVSIYLKEIIH